MIATASPSNLTVGPPGFRDLLPSEAERIAEVQEAIGGEMRAWGYRPVITPVVERIETLAWGLGEDHLKRLLKLTDFDGSVLALVGERTVPVARLLAGPLRSAALPMRISYAAPVVSRHRGHFANRRQTHQAGAELIGASGANADAEIIALAVRSLEAARIPIQQVDVGHTDFLNGLIDSFRLGPAIEADVRAALQRRDFVTLEAVLDRAGLRDAEHELLLRFPALRGGSELLDAAAALVRDRRTARALDELAQVLSVLDHHGVNESVVIDLGAIRDFDYYSGVVFEVRGSGQGPALAVGGRYDELLARFGRPVAATGFVIELEVSAEATGGTRAHRPPVDAALAWSSPAGLPQAIAFAASLRLFGMRAVVDTGRRTPESARRWISACAARHLVVCDGEETMRWWKPSSRTVRLAPDRLMERLAADR